MNPLHIKVSKPLDELGVAYIRGLYKVWGLTSTEITGLTGVANTTVRDILTRRTWSHVPDGLTSWSGTHGRHELAPLDYGCGDAHPEQSDVWCFRGHGHRGQHLWVEPWRTQSESTAWLALELRAVTQEPEEGPQQVDEPVAGTEPAEPEPEVEAAVEEWLQPVEDLAEKRQRVRDLGSRVVKLDADLLERLKNTEPTYA